MLDKAFNETYLPIPMIFAFEAVSCLPYKLELSSLGNLLCWRRCWFNN